PAHVLAERGHGQLLRDLRLLDVRPAAAPPHEIPLAREVVQRRPDGQPRDAEIDAELPFGGDRGADAETLDELEHLRPGGALLRHLRRGSDRFHVPATIEPLAEVVNAIAFRRRMRYRLHDRFVAEITLDNVSKVFSGGVVAVDGVSLTIGSGEFLVLV